MQRNIKTNDIMKNSIALYTPAINNQVMPTMYVGDICRTMMTIEWESDYGRYWQNYESLEDLDAALEDNVTCEFVSRLAVARELYEAAEEAARVAAENANTIGNLCPELLTLR